MPTDGADFKRRVKYHGKTYTEIKSGSDEATVANYGTAGLARELLGDNPISAYRQCVLATVDCLEGIFARDRGCLLRELQARLNSLSEPFPQSPAQLIILESIIREAGKISCEPTSLERDVILARLFSANGRDLNEGLVIEKAGDYAIHHRGLSLEGLDHFKQLWREAANMRLTDMMRSLFEKGKIDREFTKPLPGLAPVRADSYEDLNSPLTL